MLQNIRVPEAPSAPAEGAPRATPAPPSAEQRSLLGQRPPTPRARPSPWLIVPLLAAFVALVWVALTAAPFARPLAALTASGTVEADDVLIASEVMGRIVELAPEGGYVRSRDVVARLDDSLLQLQLRQAAENPTQYQLLTLQADRYQLRAPSDGIVSRVPAHVGEVASPGQTLLAISDLTNLKLTVYVLERELGKIQIGQRVAITADPYDGRVFPGVVTSTNPRAEFTPRNVQTQRDRLNLVFGVQVRVSNPDLALKPGMPVDATFAEL